MTIVISSHLLGEVEKMVSHVGIILKGRMLFQGPLSELHSFQQKGARLLIKSSDNLIAHKILQEYHPEAIGDVLSLPYEGDNQVAAINKTLLNNNLDVYLLHPRANDLEQLFIDLTSTQS